MNALGKRTSTWLRAVLGPHTLIVRRMRTDLLLLALYATLVGITVAVTAVVPTLAAQASEAGIQEAVAADPSRSEVVAAIELDDARYNLGRINPFVADDVQSATSTLHDRLDDTLSRVLGPPVATVTSGALVLPLADSSDATLRLQYVWSEDATGVMWVAGRAPGAEPADVSTTLPELLPIEVGLSEAVAATTGLDAGDTVEAHGRGGQKFDLAVTGIFTPVDPGDQVWAHAPGLVDPVVVPEDGGTRTTLGALLGDNSLPIARIQQTVTATVATYTFPALPAQFTVQDSAAIDASLGRLRARPTDLTRSPGPAVGIATELDAVLEGYSARLHSATSQGAVIAMTLAIVSALALFVCGGLLAARRRPVLEMEGARGSSGTAVVSRIAAESLVVTAVGATVGYEFAGLRWTISDPWSPALVVVLLVAVAASPMATAIALRPWASAKPQAANRTDRRRASSVRRARRNVADGLLVALALSALIAARARGVTQSVTGSIDPLLIAAPVLIALAATVVIVRLMPLVLRGLRLVAAKTRGHIGLVAAARAQSARYGGPAIAAITVALSMILMCGVLAESVATAQDAAATEHSGADVLVAADDMSLLEAAAEVADSAGVDAVAMGRVDDSVQVRDGSDRTTATVMLVDSAAYNAVAAAMGTPTLDVDTLTGVPGPPPALVTSGVASDLSSIDVRWANAYVSVDVVGSAAPLPGVDTPTVVMDSQRFSQHSRGAEEARVPVLWDTMWVAGPGADAAVAAAPSLTNAIITSRSEYLTRVREAPLTSALSTALTMGVWLFSGYAALVLVLWVIASSPERGRTLSALRTLGLSRPAATLISVGELTPMVTAALVAASVIGLAVPTVLAHALDLAALAGGSPATVTWSWQVWSVACGVALASLLFTLAVEAAGRRRTRLGQVLRVGDPS